MMWRLLIHSRPIVLAFFAFLLLTVGAYYALAVVDPNGEPTLHFVVLAMMATLPPLLLTSGNARAWYLAGATTGELFRAIIGLAALAAAVSSVIVFYGIPTYSYQYNVASPILFIARPLDEYQGPADMVAPLTYFAMTFAVAIAWSTLLANRRIGVLARVGGVLVCFALYAPNGFAGLYGMALPYVAIIVVLAIGFLMWTWHGRDSLVAMRHQTTSAEPLHG